MQELAPGHGVEEEVAVVGGGVIIKMVVPAAVLEEEDTTRAASWKTRGQRSWQLMTASRRSYLAQCSVHRPFVCGRASY